MSARNRMAFAGVAALVTSRVTAPARPTRSAAQADAVAGPARCRCGHDAEAHEHFRPGTDCGACGAGRCGRFRAERRGRLGRRA